MPTRYLHLLDPAFSLTAIDPLQASLHWHK